WICCRLSAPAFARLNLCELRRGRLCILGRMGRLSALTHACTAATSLLLVGASPLQNATYDVLIVGGTVIDGSGSAPVRNDVAIKNGRIAAISRFPKAAASDLSDAL